MVLTRFAKRWWAPPVLLALLWIDLAWVMGNGGSSCQVGKFIDSVSPSASDCVTPPHAHVAIWADGDARVISDKGYKSTKPVRTDQPLDRVTAWWGGGVQGFLAPCQRVDGFHFNIWDGTQLPGVPVATVVADALDDAGLPLSPGVRMSLQSEGVTRTTAFIWWGAAHDLIVVPAWVVALGAVGYRLVALGRWANRQSVPDGHCVTCRYDLAGLPRGCRCPECGEAFADQPAVERRRNAA